MSATTHTIAARHVCALAVALAGLLALAVAPAQEARKAQEQRTKQTVAMNQATYEKLQEIQQLVEANELAEAHKQLDKLRERRGMSPYELAQTWNLTAFTYYQEERYNETISAYKRVLEQPDLPEALIQSTLKTLSQLYFTIEDYQQALVTVKQLIELVPDPSADVYMLLGQAYFQLRDYDNALEPIETGIQKYRAQGKTPRENWLLLLRVIYYEKKDFPKMVNVLFELLEHYPKDQYLLTLAGAYSELDDTKKQLVLTEGLYDMGLLTNPQYIVNLANLYVLHEMPYKAAALLQKEIDDGRVEATVRHLRLLSQAWYQAREDARSIAPLARAAAKSQDGELYVRLAQSHINLEQWQEAADAIRKALELGNVDRPDTANIMLGMALFNQQQLQSARRAFSRAADDRRSSKVARQWMTHVDKEMERIATLNQELPDRPTRTTDALLQDQSG